jgi:uncharacterized protein Yka (UPF0111/DUF47 family)
MPTTFTRSASSAPSRLTAQFIVRREIFNQLERITDALEDVANEIDGLVIDHA